MSSGLGASTRFGLVVVIFHYAAGILLAQSPLAKGFLDPPPETKPWVYWYWASDRISREGITKDLESMARVGIGEALIGNVLLLDVDRGPVKALTEEWWSLVEHAIREGGRVGVDLGIFNCPGWSQAGGPWVKPEQSMRYLWTGEMRATGWAKFEGAILTPKPFQDVALLAFPAPKPGREIAFPRPQGAQDRGPITFTLDLPELLTARSLVLRPGPQAFSAKCRLLCADGWCASQVVREFTWDRSQAQGVAQIGPLRSASLTVALPPTMAKGFILMVERTSGNVDIAEAILSDAARVDRFVEKQLGVMHQDPMPPWDAYTWPAQPEPGAPDLVVPPERVIDLSDALGPDGVVRWDVPAGDWVIVRAGMTPTGAENAPTGDEARGFEVDKMSRAAVAAHFDGYVGKLLARMPAADRRALKHVVADSWEAGPQNWTDGLADDFLSRYGYDPRPWLPALTGRVVGSAGRSDRFLWDLRRLVADRVASDYAGGLRDACSKHGLKLWLQNYGHWGFPAEFLQYGGQTDEIAGEFWANMPYGAIEMRAASSAAHVYGKQVVSAEAFTGGRPFQETPWSLKRLGDRALASGINHFALHLFFHQPTEDRPGINAWFGTEINRHNTWYGSMGSWIDYWRSAQFLLRQGRHVADVAYFIGEDAPKMTGLQEPRLPPGHDFDWIDADAIERLVRVEDGRFTVPGGSSWRILVLPPLDTMRPALLRKIRDLVDQGGAILGRPPTRSPSLAGYPACDAEVQAVAAELWEGCDGRKTTHVGFGRGHVFRGVGLRAALDELGTPPDVSGIDAETILWTHRATPEGDVYFLSNQGNHAVSIAPAFRVADRAPEIWAPDRRTIARTAAFARSGGTVRVPLELDAGGSAVVVFREPAVDAPAITEVTCNGRAVLTTESRPAARPNLSFTKDGAFTMALWLLPDADITLPVESDSGVATPRERNDAVFPYHAGTLFRDAVPRHAFAGISAGRNGIVVYEHSTEYFAPVLVHAAPIASWTHVAVAYSGNRSSLYLNGALVRQGLQSKYKVHASPDATDPAIMKVLRDAGVETGKPFIGELGQLLRTEGALDAAEIAALARTPVALGAARPLLTITRAEDGGLEAEAAVGGAYRGKLADGRVLDLPVPALPPPRTLEGPWEVLFPTSMDVPERVTFERLIPWTDHANEAIRCFSGTAAYGLVFEVRADWLAEGRRVLLDLGSVESLAEVFVNGRSCGTLWKPPFVVDVTTSLQPRSNSISIRVTNTWWNRLVGFQKNPDGFPGAGPLQFKPRLSYDDRRRLVGDLAPSGLIGPVRLHATQRLRVASR